MKIGDIKEGVEYGVIDSRHNRYSQVLPRRVTVLAIEQSEVEYWAGGGGGFTSERKTKKVRKVRVRFEDEPTNNRRYYANEVGHLEKGTECLIEARLFVAPWKELRADVLARITQRDLKADAEASMASRINALLPKKLRDEYIHVRASVLTHPASKAGQTTCEVSLRDDVLETIIALAEKGAAPDA